MKFKSPLLMFALCASVILAPSAYSQIGRRFPSERKVVKDPVTGTILTFLTSSQNGDSKIYQTHNQWTSDGQWLIFRSGRVPGEAMAVNEKTGEMVQVTEGGYMGILNIARKSMKLYFMRSTGSNFSLRRSGDFLPGRSRDTSRQRVGDTSRRRTVEAAPVQIIEVDLAKVFADSKAGTMKPASVYQRVCGTTPAALGAGGDMALDGAEDRAYFRVGREEAAKHIRPNTKKEGNFGLRNMGAGPSGIAGITLIPAR